VESNFGVNSTSPIPAPHCYRDFPQFRFGVISTDPDDNKFVDGAIAGQAKVLMTSDRHFAEVQYSGHGISVVSPDEFAKLI
jgi:uncharacterized protein